MFSVASDVSTGWKKRTHMPLPGLLDIFGDPWSIDFMSDSFLTCIYISNFEVKPTNLYKPMIMLFGKLRSFTTLYIVIWRLLDSFLNVK